MSTIQKHYKVEYTDRYTEEMDSEGLSVYKWSMFDSPCTFGSGKMFMESEPVFILDAICKSERIFGYILTGYVSKNYGDKSKIPTNSGHRVGNSIKFKCKGKEKRFKFVKGLIQYGVSRIHIGDDFIYFDTDSYLKRSEIVIH